MRCNMRPVVVGRLATCERFNAGERRARFLLSAVSGRNPVVRRSLDDSAFGCTGDVATISGGPGTDEIADVSFWNHTCPVT